MVLSSGTSKSVAWTDPQRIQETGEARKEENRIRKRNATLLSRVLGCAGLAARAGEMTMTGPLNSTTQSARCHRMLTFLTTRWPECALALAMLAAVIVSGCKSGHC